MKHYTTPGIVKCLAIRLVAAQVACGMVSINNRKQFRAAVVAAAHSAFMDDLS